MTHERYCDNCRCLTQVNRAGLAGYARKVESGLIRQASSAPHDYHEPFLDLEANRNE